MSVVSMSASGLAASRSRRSRLSLEIAIFVGLPLILRCLSCAHNPDDVIVLPGVGVDHQQQYAPGGHSQRMPPLLTVFHPIEGHEKERIRPHQFSVFKSDVVLV